MEMAWKGIIGGLIVGAKGDNAGFPRVLHRRAPKTIPAYLASFRCVISRRSHRLLALLGGLPASLVVALAIFLAPRWT